MHIDILDFGFLLLSFLFVVALWAAKRSDGRDDGRNTAVFSCYSFERTPDYLTALESERTRIDEYLLDLFPDMSSRYLKLSRSHITTSYVSMPVWACERDVGLYADRLVGASIGLMPIEIELLPAMKFSRLLVLDHSLVLAADDEDGMLTLLNGKLREVVVDGVVRDSYDSYTPHVSLYSLRGMSSSETLLLENRVKHYLPTFEVSRDFFVKCSGASYSPSVNWRIRTGAPCPGDITP